MFLYTSWRAIPLPTRIKLAAHFGIKKIGPTHVRDNYVESDGYKIEDVEAALNIDKLQAYLGTQETDMAKLLEWAILKVEGCDITALVSEPTNVNGVQFEGIEEFPDISSMDKVTFTPHEAPLKKKRGRPAKNK